MPSSLYIILVAAWAWVYSARGEECHMCRLAPCRKVTGLFTRSRLPVGYNLIARVPPRTCNLTVTELQPSNNYLAIRTDHGYIINGNWAILPPGRYMGAGTGFFYSRPRTPGEVGEVIQAPGPLTVPVDIMLIHQSTNTGVKYEYWHPIVHPDITPATVQGRTPPRSSSPLRHVLPAYQARPGGDGGAVDTRPLTPALPLGGRGDGGDRGETTGPSWRVWKFTPCSKTCGGGQQQTVYICTSPTGAILSDDVCESPKPPAQTVHCNPRPCPPSWQLGEWSQCSVTCGSGVMTRTWACVQEVTPTLTRSVPPAACPGPLRAPAVPLIQPCTMAPCTKWEVTAWTQCSVECGTGLKTRQVTCRADGRRVGAEECNIQEKPPSQQLCHAHSCAHHTWFYTDWSEECFGGCEDGVQRRRVWCLPGVNSVEGECDLTQRPPDTRPCPLPNACAAAWFTGPWSPCSDECGNGTRSREVVCVVFLRGTFRATLDIECDATAKPNDTQSCNPDPCPPHWYYTDWSPCSRTCGRGTKTRAVQCLDQHQQLSSRCSIADKPLTARPCVEKPCNKPSDRSCVDRFRNCLLVQQARLCRYSYYRSVCCASCFQQ
ncbi:LOW QUALITY PROTEIN: ADAMTS-like protein 4 [Portunus trituberculatus]|uniref:LOW QUALITY PROTEIN: ADAMTS-like protein 4 n=1 Tax=Portunus trituberculatus TaxID=210409 RepID=UPI001E1CB6E0|nr:LOW QUALITY PROTEIN: ADAMTS-like protein 4 [Portunus trituberculatus]